MKLVIFDVDGTLVDSQAHILAAMRSAFADCGMPCPPRARILGIVGLSLPQAMSRLAPDADTHRLVEAYKNSFAQMRATEASPLYPGARAALEALAARADLFLGVATGKSRRGLTHVLAAHRLEGYFITSQVADDHPSKPSPSMVLTAMQQAGTVAQNTVMIGDTSFDMAMGRAAGVHTIGVSWGYHPVSDLTQADRVIDDFAALPGVVAGLWRGE